MAAAAGGCKEGGGGGSSGKGGGCGSSGYGSYGVMMKAPGGNGSYTSRSGFESNPKGYFHDLHHGDQGRKN